MEGGTRRLRVAKIPRAELERAYPGGIACQAHRQWDVEVNSANPGPMDPGNRNERIPITRGGIGVVHCRPTITTSSGHPVTDRALSAVTPAASGRVGVREEREHCGGRGGYDTR